MLETMFLEYLLLFMLYIYLLKIDADRRNLLNISSENGDISATSKTCTNIQSAENCKEFSETIRQISNYNNGDNSSFFKWFAGIVDGDGNFDLRNINNKLVLKAIRIKLHDRDVRILTYIQNILHMGAVWLGTLQLCPKLSNSGELLKLLIPSCSWKTICGWTNYSGVVTSQNMIEREMEYRGSKSVVVDKYSTVKEQRVDDSWQKGCGPCLRCILMGFERNYQARIPSNQIKNRKNLRSFHSTRVVRNDKLSVQNIQNFALHPWYLTGFVDAEGSFLIIIRKNNNLKIGWNVELRFQISLHEKDAALLEQIKKYFGVGSVKKEGAQVVKYYVLSIKDISVIISHFDKYTLHTQKRADYELFKQAFSIILSKEHLTMDGLRKIVALKASLNLGLPEQLKKVFTEKGNDEMSITPVGRPLVTDQAIKDPYWLAGFTDGDGSFGVKIKKSSSSKIGHQVYLQFNIIQHARDALLLKSFEEFFKCGKVYLHSENAIFFSVTKYSDITNIIIPFFNKHPIPSVKSKDFKDFCLAAELMKNGAHLTEQGLNQIRLIKGGMNTGRKFS